MLMTNKALILFSGGQDSTTCLAWSLEKFDEVYTLGFDYGQRHSIELECRKNILIQFKNLFSQWRNKIKNDTLLDLRFYKEFSDNALTTENEIKMMPSGLPSTFVPGRNIVFLSIASSFALSMNIENIVLGVCETDYSGYPDCRNNFIKSMNNSINLGTDKELKILTPLMFLDKSQSWSLAYKLGHDKLINLIIDETHSCYRGVRDIKYEWGYGCNNCFACNIRSNGWSNYSNLS